MRLLQAELLKLWTVRTPKVLLGVAAVIAVIAAAIQIIIIETRDGDPTLSTGQVAGLLAGAAAAIPLATFIGAVGATSEIRHRTDYLNHLITPTRVPQVAARIGAYLMFGLAFASILLSALLLILFSWALVRVGTVPWGSTPTRILLGVALATAAYTVIGLAIGQIFRNQILAVSLLGAWMFAIEGFIVLPLALIDLRLTSLMPIQAIQALLIGDALVETEIGAISFGVWQTAGIILAWTVSLSAIGIWRTLRSDIR